jgi:hypothetical protein
MIVGPSQPLAGTVMRVRAKNIVTKKKKQDFTVCEFELYDGTPAQVLQMRRACKLSPPAEASPASASGLHSFPDA